MDKTQFRLDFPEFASTTKYPDSQLDFWATLAEAQVVVNLWGDIAPLGVKLYVAHEITMAAQNTATAAIGGTPGVQGGIANTKAVGSASVGYDTTSSAERDAGWWNLTNYGKQFIRLARIFGAGCIQL